MAKRFAQSAPAKRLDTALCPGRRGASIFLHGTTRRDVAEVPRAGGSDGRLVAIVARIGDEEVCTGGPARLADIAAEAAAGAITDRYIPKPRKFAGRALAVVLGHLDPLPGLTDA